MLECFVGYCKPVQCAHGSKGLGRTGAVPTGQISGRKRRSC